MANYKKALDDLVDRFVMHVNTHEREPILTEDVPASVREGPPDDFGYCDWRIRPHPRINWIETIEQSLGLRFPALYRSLITRYIFPPFSVSWSKHEGIHFLANTPEGAGYRELRERLLIIDDGMRSKLLEHGYLLFANPYDDPTSDPLCFDLNRNTGRDSHPIVRLFHEDLIIRPQKKIKAKDVTTVASSLEEMLIKAIGEERMQSIAG